MTANEAFIERSVEVRYEARARMARLHPDMGEEQLEEAAHEVELAYLCAVRDVFVEIVSFAEKSPHGLH